MLVLALLFKNVGEFLVLAFGDEALVGESIF